MKNYLFAVVLGLAALFLFRWGFLCPGFEPEPDGFYHMQIVEEGPRVFCAKKFPWLQQTNWKEQFSDKELGFHFLLWDVTRVGKFLGAANDHPFHYQTLFFDFLILLALAAILYRQKIPHPALYVILFISVFPTMMLRMLFLRAYLLSMAINGVLLCCLLEDGFHHWKWRRVVLFAFGFLESWCYSSPHLILLTVVPFAIADFLAERKWRCLFDSPCVVFLGLLVGLTIHPQFPNTFVMFKIQCIDVIQNALFHTIEIPVPAGNEFYMSTTLYSLKTGGMLLILWVALAWMLVRYRKSLFPVAGAWRKNRAFNGLVLLALLSTLASLCFFRFNEYALIPQVVLFATLITRLEKAQAPTGNKTLWTKPKKLFFMAFILVSLLLNCRTNMRLPYSGFGYAPYYGLVHWAEENKIPEGTVIANMEWDTFPMLFFALPQCRYVSGLDPAFTWRYNPEALELAAAAAYGKPLPSPQKYREVFQTRYIHVARCRRGTAENFWRHGFVPVYDDWCGWIFDLDAPPRHVDPRTPPLKTLPKEDLFK